MQAKGNVTIQPRLKKGVGVRSTIFLDFRSDFRPVGLFGLTHVFEPNSPILFEI